MSPCPLCKEKPTDCFKSRLSSIIRSDGTKIELKEKLCIFYCDACSHYYKDSEFVNKHSNYSNYSQDKEFQSLDPIGLLNPRYRKISDYINLILKGKKKPNILDYGCNKGDFLSLMSGNLYGYDISEKYRKSVEAIPAEFFTSINAIQSGIFDIVTLLHVLEHLKDPISEVKNLIKFLSQDAKILIQIPNSEIWKSDFYVADHAHHFTKYSIFKALNSIEGVRTSINTPFSDLELTAVCEMGPINKNILRDCRKSNGINSKQLFNELTHFEETVLELDKNKEILSIYGLSLFARLLLQNVDEKKIKYIIDDNPQLEGQKFCNIPVVSLLGYLKNSFNNNSVILALQGVGAEIVSRNCREYKINFLRVL